MVKNVCINNKFESTLLYVIAKMLPKGILLHAHFPAVVNITEFIKFLKKNNPDIYKNIYYVSDYNKINEWINEMIIIYPDFIKKYKSFNVPFDAEKYEDNNYNYGLTYFPNEPPCKGYEKISLIVDLDVIQKCSQMANNYEYDWKFLEQYTNSYWSFIKNDQIYELYFEYLLNEAINDNLYGIELKTNLGSLHSKRLETSDEWSFSNNNIYTGEWNEHDELELLKNIIDKFKDKIYCNLIIGQPRTFKTVDLEISINSLKKKCNQYSNIDIIKSIDIFGEESISHNNNNFIDTLINDCNKLNYTIHSGETNSKEIDENLLSIILLKNKYPEKTVRVGHGISLINSPSLMNIYKKLDIHIELCPLSNYILGYTPNLKNHPGKQYIKSGLNVSINSDDPSIYNYHYVSYDWFIVLGLWNLTKDEIKQLCLNSINSSFMSNNQKLFFYTKLNNDFDKWWSKYCDDDKLGNAINESKKILNNFSRYIYTTDIFQYKYLKYKNKYLKYKI